MDIDHKVSFIAGWTLTTVTSINLMGIFQAALVGLVGGFFGLFGKEVYYYVKEEAIDKLPEIKAWIKEKKEWLKSKINDRS